MARAKEEGRVALLIPGSGAAAPWFRSIKGANEKNNCMHACVHAPDP